MPGRLVLVLVLLLTQLSSSKLSCPPPLNAGIYACRGHGLREVPLPIGAPTKSRLAIGILDVNDNFIEILHEDALRPYPSLIRLSAERNLLWKITDVAFKTVPRLESLLLRGNRLVVQSGSFSPKALLNLRHLRFLDLSENPVGVIPNHFFVPSLMEIHLERTLWSLIFMKGAFLNLPRLRQLNLANNHFNTLPSHLEKELEDLTELQTLKLHGNTWQCDCHLAWLGAVAQRFNETPRCQQPPGLAGRILTDLPPEEFQCAPVALNKKPPSSAENHHLNEAEAGSTIQFTCTFHFEPQGRITWFKDNDMLPRNRAVEAVVGHSLVQTNITLENLQAGRDDGLYRCEAANARGLDSIVFPLKVRYQAEGAKGSYQVSRLLFGLIIGGGGFLLCLSVTSIVLYCYQKDREVRRRDEAQRQTMNMKREPREHLVQPPSTWHNIRTLSPANVLSQTDDPRSHASLEAGTNVTAPHYHAPQDNAWLPRDPISNM